MKTTTTRRLLRCAIGVMLGWVLAQGRAVADSPDVMVRTDIFEGRFGRAGVTRIVPGLAEALGRFLSTNRLQGWVLDLRGAQGGDYRAAAAAADPLVPAGRPLLRWDDVTLRAQEKSQNPSLPLVILVNGETAGAAEALAGVLKAESMALVIGSPTPGAATPQAAPETASPLPTVVAGEDLELSRGVTPDIQIQTAAENEHRWLADPWWQPPIEEAGETNRTPQVRLNEAELVRRREGGGAVRAPARTADPAARPIGDPVLRRALDLLRGLVVLARAPAP